MKGSTITKVEFFPKHDRTGYLYITRKLANGVLISRQYPNSTRNIGRIINRAQTWRWIQPHVGTPRIERP